MLRSNQGGVKSAITGLAATKVKERVDSIVKAVRRALGPKPYIRKPEPHYQSETLVCARGDCTLKCKPCMPHEVPT